MTAQFGQIALYAALILSTLAALATTYGTLARKEKVAISAQAGLPIVFASVLASFIALTYAFITSDFSISLVAQHSHTGKPFIYKITGVWANHEGSILLWVLILALFGALAARKTPTSIPAPVFHMTLAIQALLIAGFLGFIIFTSNPFALLDVAPAEGNGMNPLLQDPGLAIHPPLLYIGYVGLSLPFAGAVAALLVGEIDKNWADWLRPWTLVTWSFLTLGITIGSLWAWYELGWGGWWVWDPVENISLMPWLMATALLHSLMVMQRRAMMARWTVLLAIAAFSFSLIGTFVVRSGILLSVHSFATDPARGVVILALLGVFTGVALLAYTFRAHKLAGSAELPIMSKGGALVLNNIFLVTATVIVFLGTFYPLFMDLISGEIVSVGEPYFNALIVPVALVFILFMAAGPLMKWQNGEFAHIKPALLKAGLLGAIIAAFIFIFSKKLFSALVIGLILFALACGVRAFLRPGGTKTPLKVKRAGQWGFLLGHVGMLILALGITWVTGWGSETRAVMKPGQTMALGEYSFTMSELDGGREPTYMYISSDVIVSKNGRELGPLSTERRFYPTRGMFTSEAGFRLSPVNTVFVGLGDGNLEDGFIIRAYHSPGVIWIWVGGILMALGGFVSACDKRGRRQEVSS